MSCRSSYVPETSHNVPDVFVNFMNASGPVLSGKFLGNDKLINWVYALGYPISELAWQGESIWRLRQWRGTPRHQPG